MGVYSKNFTHAVNFIGSIGFLPLISGQIVPSSAIRFGSQILQTGDQGWLEHVTSSSLRFNSSQRGGLLNLIQSNSLKIHFLSFLFLLLLLLVVRVKKKKKKKKKKYSALMVSGAENRLIKV